MLGMVNVEEVIGEVEEPLVYAVLQSAGVLVAAFPEFVHTYQAPEPVLESLQIACVRFRVALRSADPDTEADVLRVGTAEAG